MKRLMSIGLCLCFINVFSQNTEDQFSIKVTSLTDTLTGGVGEIDRDVMGNLFVADFGDKVWKISPWGDVSVFNNSMYGASGNARDEGTN